MKENDIDKFYRDLKRNKAQSLSKGKSVMEQLEELKQKFNIKVRKRNDVKN